MTRLRYLAVLLPACAVLGTTVAVEAAPRASSTTPPAAEMDEAAVEELVAAAQAEGELMFYSTNLDPVNDAVAAAFEETYGIDANHVPRESGPILLDRYRAEEEGGGSPADVLISTSRGALDQLHTDGLLETLDPEVVPALASLGSDSWTETTAVVSVIPFMVCWNTDRIDGSSFTEMRDVLLPEDPDIKVVTTNLQFEAYNTALDVLRQEYGIEFLQEAGERGFIFAESAPAAQQLLISGEADVFFMCPPSVGATSVSQGAPVDYRLIGPTSATQLAAGIALDSPHPAAARLFVHWLMTPEGAAVMNGGGLGVTPVLPEGDEATGILPFPTEADGYFPPHNADIENVEEIHEALGTPTT